MVTLHNICTSQPTYSETPPTLVVPSSDIHLIASEYNSVKNKSKKNNVVVCFNDCKLQRLGNKEMVQCHICQTWAHYTCIDEHKDDIIGIWCCNGCRSLPKTVAMLSNKMAELQQNMQALLLIAYSSMVKTKNTNSGAVTGRNQETPTTYVHNNMTPTDRHRSSVDTINPQQNESHEDPNETESVNIEHTLVEEPSAHQHRKYKSKTTHDVYLYVPSTRITEGAVRSYLRDIGVNDIIRISKISQNGHESEFRIIIGDEIVTHTVYGHRKFRKDSIIMPFKRYRSNSTPIRHHGMSNQEESRNQKREMRDRQRDQPAADSRVTMDRQIHQPAADTLLPRPANTNVDPVIPRSATTRNDDLYPSIKGQGHRELFQDPANHQPSLAHLSTLSQHLSSSRNQTREMRDIQRDQPAADSRVMTDRQIHQPTADTLLPRPANTNVDPVIPRSETTSNVDLYPSIKGQGH